MKRAIPNPVIVPLVGGKAAPASTIAPVASPTDLRQMKVDEFLQARSLQPKSEQAYQRDLHCFMDWTAQAWGNVTRRQVAQFKQYLLQERKLAPNSVNRTIRTLKTFYRWLLESEYVESDPTTAVKQEKAPPAQSQELEDDEVDRIYQAIEQVSRDKGRDRALFSLLLHGLRAQEAVNLNLEDYDRQQVVIRQAKHDSVGEVPLARAARTHLDAYVQQRQAQAAAIGQELLPHSPLLVSNSNRSKGQRLTYWGVQEVMDKLAEHTGIPLRAHRGRHTYCTNLIVKLEMDTAQRVLILTGGPGVGKTFTTRTIVALWKAMGKSIALASPTGRAAQRLSEMTGKEAKTIHRLLEFDPKHMQFQRNSDNPIEAQAIVVDEALMLDLFLANSLIKAIALDAQLLLVGDIDQLPSVGPGAVLQDLIASQQVPVVQLTQVFRQAQASQIVTNAHRINQGQLPKLEPVSDTPRSGCLGLSAAEPEHGLQALEALITDLIPKLGFNPAVDVQVLSPMTRGTVGTRNLNTVLQAILNPPSAAKAELIRSGMTLRVGDRVMQKVNDYDREVFNGDLGVIGAIDIEEQEVKVQYGERVVSYDYADLNEITLAWAVTIHKSQGSEYPVVILPIYMQHYLMLSRNLIYTGLTRAKRLAIVVGPQKAIALAVRQVKDRERYTLLDQRLGQLRI